MSSGKLLTHNFLRENGLPTFYGPLKYKIWIDITFFRIFSIFLITFITFLVILPGFRGVRKFYVLARCSISLLILFFIAFCNYMPYWEQAKATVQTPYRAGSNNQINATIGLNIGLRGINVTLVGHPVKQHNDIIDYNEEFEWTWSQGKTEFGYDAGTFMKNYRKAQFRGLPFPILWVAETFTIDYEYVRIGRYYRQAGWYSHVFLWSAVPLFILSNILFQMVIQYGSLFIILTGCSLLTANLIQTFLRSTIPFNLIFQSSESLSKVEFLTTHYSWCYYLNLINGVLCIAIGLLTLIIDLRHPDEIADFFGNDVLQSYDYFADLGETQTVIKNNISGLQPKSDEEVLLRKKPALEIVNNSRNDVENNITQQQFAEKKTSGLIRRTISNGFSRFQKSTIRHKTPLIQTLSNSGSNGVEGQKNGKQLADGLEHETPLYENFRQFDTIGEEEANTSENES